MVKTKALEKAVKFFKSKKIVDFRFDQDEKKDGLFTTWRAGIKYEIRIQHDSCEIRIVSTKTEYR